MMDEKALAQFETMKTKTPLMSGESRYAICELTAEVRRCWGRIEALLRANNEEVERRRAIEQKRGARV